MRLLSFQDEEPSLLVNFEESKTEAQFSSFDPFDQYLADLTSTRAFDGQPEHRPPTSSPTENDNNPFASPVSLPDPFDSTFDPFTSPVPNGFPEQVNVFILDVITFLVYHHSLKLTRFL